MGDDDADFIIDVEVVMFPPPILKPLVRVC